MLPLEILRKALSASRGGRPPSGNATYGRTPGDVRRWPADDSARRALDEYFKSFSPDPKAILPMLDGGGLDFTGADLSGLELCGAEFSEADLRGVRLAGAYLGGAWLMGANLRGADLSRSSLWKVQGRACDAEGAVAKGAYLGRAEFEHANLRGADLRKARLGRAWLPDTDLRGADLRGCRFGVGGQSTGLLRARMAGCLLHGASGGVSGPIDVGEDSPHLLDGADLASWFADRGARQVEVDDHVRP